MLKSQMLLGVLVILALSASALPALTGSANITGSYSCVGQNPDGGEYKGNVEIAMKGDTYLLTWEIGGQTHTGVGLLNGDLLSSSWKSGNTHGVVVYRVEGNRLVGQWSTYPGNGKIQTETLTKQ